MVTFNKAYLHIRKQRVKRGTLSRVRYERQSFDKVEELRFAWSFTTQAI